MKTFKIILLCVMSALMSAQCPTITMPSTLQLTTCATGQTFAATSNYTANIVSRWIGRGNVPLVSSGGANSVVYLNYVATHTVEFTDTLSHCVVRDSVKVTSNIGKPVFLLTSPQNFTLGCGAFSITAIHITNASATNSNQIPNGGPVTYTFGPGAFTPASGILSPNSSYTVNSCGPYQLVVQDNNSGCNSSFNIDVKCTNLSPKTTLSVSPNTTVCLATGGVIMASGATSYKWSTGQVFPQISVAPPTNTTYYVKGFNIGPCYQLDSVFIMVDSTCIDVWPGDCNNDKIVDNTDVFEIGLNYNHTGPPRAYFSIAFTSQESLGFGQVGSFSQNECHIDCNGDGTIDASDTVAIFNNYLLTHPKQAASQGPALLAMYAGPSAAAGYWNKVRIEVPAVYNSPLYGVAFDIDFNPGQIETDSVYLSYPVSFLTAPGKNVFFRKTDFAKGKIYAANVRNTGTSVSGPGLIAEFHYKLKANVPPGQQITFYGSKAKSCDSQGNVTAQGGDSAYTYAVFVGVNEIDNLSRLSVFPNPAKNELTVQGITDPASYSFYDVTGRLITAGQLGGEEKIDVSALPAGSYQLKLETVTARKSIKVLIIH